MKIVVVGMVKMMTVTMRAMDTGIASVMVMMLAMRRTSDDGSKSKYLQ